MGEANPGDGKGKRLGVLHSHAQRACGLCARAQPLCCSRLPARASCSRDSLQADRRRPYPQAEQGQGAPGSRGARIASTGSTPPPPPPPPAACRRDLRPEAPPPARPPPADQRAGPVCQAHRLFAQEAGARPSGETGLLRLGRPMPLQSRRPASRCPAPSMRHLQTQPTLNPPLRPTNNTQFVYLREAFSPAPEERVQALYDAFGVDGRLVVSYALQPAWG